MKPWVRQAAALALVLAGGSAPVLAAGRTPSPPGATVYFISPQAGPVSGTITVRAGLRGMGVMPAGETAKNAGHHHLLIDTRLANLDAPLPVNNNVVHFSNGETEVEINLSRGWHQLQLVFTDGNHMNFDPPVVSKPISILVTKR